MKTNLKIFIFLFINFLLCTQGLCEVRVISIKNSDTVSIDTPSSWVSQTTYDQKNLATIQFAPSNNNDLNLKITVMKSIFPNNPSSSNSELKHKVSSSLAEVSSSAVEKEILIKEFKKEESTCYYFTATDRDPKSNEFSIITQGILRGKNFLMPFTALYNDKKTFSEETLINILSTVDLHISTTSPEPNEQGAVKPNTLSHQLPLHLFRNSQPPPTNA